MQRLVLAMLLLALFAGGLALAVASARASLRIGSERGVAVARAGIGGETMQKLSYLALFLLIFGVATGWLGGL